MATMARQAIQALWHRISLSVVTACLVGFAFFSLNWARYPKFFFDDSFISLRYADRLRNGLGMTWTDGERVEGCTNFLWVVILAVIGIFSNGLIGPARAMGVMFMGAGMASLVWTSRGAGWRDSAGSFFAGLAIAALGPLAAWAVGGLEVSLIVAALGVAIHPKIDMATSEMASLLPKIGPPMLTKMDPPRR